ncbi:MULTISPECIES: hypothetical protein [unclassified Calothrix]|uniref:hypothetical protein n=1 Tax=unclassified Calothrix TaxID=2619626 RepID=UPI001F55812C|nr:MULTISPECIES: hypothetical protein [unclassified Calothrix]
MTKQETDIYSHVSEHFDRAQASGLQVLIYMALREQTSIAYQHKELNFHDIPLNIVLSVDALSEDEQLYLASQIASDMFEASALVNAVFQP